jgi:pyruvate formate lyase activating enzyme
MEVYYYPDNCTRCGRCAEVCLAQASVIEPSGDGKPVLRFNRNKCIGCMKCVEACLSGARASVGHRLTFDQILRECLSDQPFYSRSGGGVTLSGGDPLLFPEFSLELSKILKRNGIHVAMETSCFADWKIIRPFLDTIDLFLVDIKSLNAEKHQEVIGWPLAPIVKNIEALIASDASVRIHLPIIPGFNDSVSDYQAAVDFLAPFARELAGVDILPFHVYGGGKYTFLGRGETYQYKNTWNKETRKVEALAQALVRIGITQVSVGGLVGMGKERGEKPLEKEVMTPN